MEELGSEILYFSADAADVESMRMVKHQAYEKFGALNGIIHAAGGTKGESIDLIPNLDRSKCEHQFRAKIAGLTIMDKLFKDEALDFCILTSSMTSFLGGWEYTAYTAANFFMDRFVIESGRWISINLDPINLYGDKDNEFCLTIPELYQTFKYILATIEKGQVLMSLSDLEVRIERASKSMLSKAIKDSKKEIYTGAGKAASFFPRPNLTTPYLSTDEIETGLVEVCRELFGYDKIGIMDDFFELGGNSLTLIRFISEIQKKFEVKIHFAEIFNKGHIRELADYIKKSEKEKYLSIELVEQKEYYPLSSAQKRLYAIQQIDKNSTGYNIPWPIELRGVIDKKKLAEVFLKMIRRHESLRTSFLQVDGEPFQKIQENIEFEITYKEAADRVEANEIIRRFIQPFDFSIAPLLRVALIKLVENNQVLMIDIHHIICDWHAMNIFVNDFMTLYMDGELPTLNLQYKDYSEWQNNERQREAIRKQEEYWLKRFKGEPPVLNLPTDFPRSALHSFDGERIGFAVDTELMEEITKILLDTGTTLFMLLLAVYSLLLSIYTGKEDIVVGIPSAGRNHIDLSNIVGMFVNMLPMRNNPNPYKTFQQYLKEVKREFDPRTLKTRITLLKIL